jgi:hypothetical protein
VADGDYEVGYGRPPTQHRFKPGQSGNPGGRPKGARSFNSLLEEQLNATVSVNVGGKKRKISVLEALLKRLVQKGLSDGDARAIERLLSLAQQIDKNRPADALPTSADDMAVLHAFMRDLEGNRDA